MDPKIPRSWTNEQEILIRRFIDAYNAIDRKLRDELRYDSSVSFSKVVIDYKERFSKWQDYDFLKMIGPLRNAIVHERNHENQILSIPIPSIVDSIEQVQKNLLKPELVYPKFKRKVNTFQIKDSLLLVLKTIRFDSYSQFPIYDEIKFKGLLTENGISRWLANYSNEEDPIIAFKEIYLGIILESEEERQNSLFIRRSTTLLEAENEFVINPALEALLITENGNPAESLMGIITRWDIIHNWK